MFSDMIQIGVFLLVLIGLAVPFGSYMAKVFVGDRTFLSPVLVPVENFLLKAIHIKKNEMSGKEYLLNLIVFNSAGFLFLFLLLLLQGMLPLNPQHLNGLSWHLAFNTAVSFMTNTNWQSYSGESTLSYLCQMLGLTVQNFLSAATGLAVLVVIIRALIDKRETLGNFWVDLTRSIIHILLPLAIIFAILFISQGVIQNFSSYQKVVTLEGQTQLLPMGPVASQIAIKQLGTNGGGYFGTNSAHVFENPTPLSNFLQMLAILLIPVASVFMFGRMVKSKKHGIAIFGAMFILFLSGLFIQYHFESRSSITNLPVYMEGKETRFGLVNSVLWAQATTCASNGSVNAMQDSFSPIAGLVSMMNLMSGEVIFGGVGAGLYGILMYIIITVFIAGLMVGRTPEYLGKKIERKEMIMSSIAVLAPAFVILLFTAIAILVPAGLKTLGNSGPHGLSEIIYAFASGAGNNGSAFAGLGTDNVFYNVMIGLAMLIGRFSVIIPVIIIANSMMNKDKVCVSIGTFRTDTPLFSILLIFIILFVGLLTFFPLLMLGPVGEHLLHLNGIVF